MTSVQERLQIKREPIDKWSLREQLCLASAVSRSGDQNWMSVSRALKPFGESNRPADWFHQKNCAAQYGALLANVETPKRKKKSGIESVVETPAECILRRLLAERQAELKNLLAEEKAEYKKLQDDMKLLQTGKVSEEQLDKWCKEIDDEQSRREQEKINHAKWLKQRDLRKQEIEKAWRPVKTPITVVSQKRKISDVGEDFIDNDRDVNPQIQQRNTISQYQQPLTSAQQCQQNQLTYTHQLITTHEVQHQPQQPLVHAQTQESVKPALSPLLTSLLKSPSQVQNISPVSTTVLHSTISNQHNRAIETSIISNPTITNLLNGSTCVAVSSNLPQIPTNDINQEVSNVSSDDSSQPLDADILDDANIKIDDLAKSILVQDGPFPEIKKEEVDDIISEIIENAHDIVADPEQHLQLDGNGDININLELDDLEQENIVEEEVTTKKESDVKPDGKSPGPKPVIDPFEFQEDPVLFDSPVKPSTLKHENMQFMSLYQQSPGKCDEVHKKTSESTEISTPRTSYEIENPGKNATSKDLQGSVEIVEVVADEHENEKELNKAQICDIVHSRTERDDKEDNETAVTPEHTEQKKTIDDAVTSDNLSQNEEKLQNESSYFEQKATEQRSEENLSQLRQTEDAPDYGDLYDNINMEVKIDRSGKTKRDYSRTKKKEEKSFDMLLAIEKAQLDDVILSDDLAEYRVENQKKDFNMRLKSENDRSVSPLTEEDDGLVKSGKRRNSTSGTPIDSLPNSPASSTTYNDDDKDYRNWKKSVMLVYNRLASNKYASLFLKPITDDQAPGYSTLVFRPMDLQTIKKNIDNGMIRTSLEFKRDVMLMFTNAIMYNKTNDTVYNMAMQMQQESMNPIEILLQAESQVDAPARRETRTSESSCKRKRLSDEPIKSKKKKDD